MSAARVLRIRAGSTNDQQPWTDEAVAMACGRGDLQAVAELFERFRIPVTRFLSRLVDGADVEDLLQATFLQIARGRASFDGRAAVKTWLLGIAVNVARMHFRSSARRRRVFHALKSIQHSPPHERLSMQLDARRTVEGVRAALESLSEKSRLAFVLCEIEGLTAREASAVLDSTEAAIWKRVSDARKALLKLVKAPEP